MKSEGWKERQRGQEKGKSIKSSNMNCTLKWLLKSHQESKWEVKCSGQPGHRLLCVLQQHWLNHWANLCLMLAAKRPSPHTSWESMLPFTYLKSFNFLQTKLRRTPRALSFAAPGSWLWRWIADCNHGPESGMVGRESETVMAGHDYNSGSWWWWWWITDLDCNLIADYDYNNTAEYTQYTYAHVFYWYWQ